MVNGGLKQARYQHTIPALIFKDSKTLLELSTHALLIWLTVQRPGCEEKKSVFEPKSLSFPLKLAFFRLVVCFLCL